MPPDEKLNKCRTCGGLNTTALSFPYGAQLGPVSSRLSIQAKFFFPDKLRQKREESTCSRAKSSPRQSRRDEKTRGPGIFGEQLIEFAFSDGLSGTSETAPAFPRRPIMSPSHRK